MPINNNVFTYDPTPQSGEEIDGVEFAEQAAEGINTALSNIAGTKADLTETDSDVDALTTSFAVHKEDIVPHGATVTPTAGHIPLYKDGGVLAVNTPIAGEDAANKEYVDELLAPVAQKANSAHTAMNNWVTPVGELAGSVASLGCRVQTAETTSDDAKNSAQSAHSRLTGLQREVYDIEEVIANLPKYDFETVTPEDSDLSAFALKHFYGYPPDDGEAPEEPELKVGIKVVNLFNNHLFVYRKGDGENLNDGTWEDCGMMFIGQATNSALGVVKGSYADYKVSVDPETGEMTCNLEGMQVTINGIIADQALEQHFRGYFSTTTEIATLSDPRDGDYAFCAETGTKWAYDEDSWIDTLDAVPDQTVPASNATPLMDGTAAVGTSEEYARGDHRHPTDTTRATAAQGAKADSAVQSATLGGAAVTKSGQTLVFPAYPTGSAFATADEARAGTALDKIISPGLLKYALNAKQLTSGDLNNLPLDSFRLYVVIGESKDGDGNYTVTNTPLRSRGLLFMSNADGGPTSILFQLWLNSLGDVFIRSNSFWSGGAWGNWVRVGRHKATGNTTFYLRTDGDNANDGTSAATAMKTFNALMERIYKEWDFQGFNVYINIGAGTWADETWTVQGTKIVGYSGDLRIIGAGQGVTFVTGSDNTTQGSGTGLPAIEIYNIRYLYLQGLTTVNCKHYDIRFTDCTVKSLNIELQYSWFADAVPANNYAHGIVSQNTIIETQAQVKFTGTQYRTTLFVFYDSCLINPLITGDAIINGDFAGASYAGTIDVLNTACFEGFLGTITGRKYTLYIGSVLRGSANIPATLAGYTDTTCIIDAPTAQNIPTYDVGGNIWIG
jgi:hypothetical protein